MPDPTEKWTKCCFKGCGREGKPSDGLDFYACEQCLDELGSLIAAKCAAMARAKRN